MTRILIVDDEKNIRRTFGMVLRREGFEPAEAERGEDALERAGARGVRPGHPGRAPARHRRPGDAARLRELQPELPVIMISGHATIATAVEATRDRRVRLPGEAVSRERVVLAVRNALRVQDLDREVRALRGAAAAPAPDGGRLGGHARAPRADRAWRRRRRRASSSAARAAPARSWSRAPCTTAAPAPAAPS